MKNLRTLLAAFALGLGLAACGDSSPALLAPEGARLDGGHTIGGGNFVAPTDSTGSAPAITSTTETMAGDSTTTERGGFTIGGGN